MADLTLILYVCAPLALLLLERPFKIITKITSYFNSMWVFKENLTLYRLGSYFFIVGLWAFFLMFIPQMIGQNPITAYYANSSGHWLSWLALVATITLFGYFDIIKGLYVAAVIYSTHELIWLIFDGVYLNQLIPLFIHFWPLVAVLSFLGAGYFLAYRSLPRWKEVAIIATMVAFDLVWLIGGWQISVQNFYPDPKTALFMDGATNLIEVLSWALPAIVVLLPTPKTFEGALRNSVGLAVIAFALQLGALGIGAYAQASSAEVDAPIAALLITYMVIQALVAFRAQHAKLPSIEFSPLD